MRINNNRANLIKTPKPKKLYFGFYHERPEDIYIVEAENKVRLPQDMHWQKISNFEDGKKHLIANDDESSYEVISNVTDDDWLRLLKKSYKDIKNQLGEYGEAEIDSPLYGYYDEDPTEQGYIDSVARDIEDSFVDGDSGSQYRWYSKEDVISLEDFLRMFRD